MAESPHTMAQPNGPAVVRTNTGKPATTPTSELRLIKPAGLEPARKLSFGPRPTSDVLLRRQRVAVLLARLLVAAIGGLGVFLSYAPIGQWWAAPLGIATLIATLLPISIPSRRLRIPAPGIPTGMLLAFTHALVTYLFLLPWVGMYVGAIAWIALAITEATYALALGAGWVVILRIAPPPRPHGGWWLAGLPLWWVAVEYIRSHWPFGGFSWARLAWGQVDGPLVWAARLGGPALVSAMTVLAAVIILLFALRAATIPLVTTTAVTAVLAAVFFTATPWTGTFPVMQQSATAADRSHRVSILDSTPTTPTPLTPPIPSDAENFTPGNSVGDGTSTPLTSNQEPSLAATTAEPHIIVAAIQGNVPRLGLNFNAQRRQVLTNHRDITVDFAAGVSKGTFTQPDLVLWPENAADVNPLEDPTAKAAVSTAVQAAKAPLILGTITTNEAGEDRNTVLAWDPTTGPGERHDKRYLQPFGEYMPYRTFFRHFSHYVDDAGNFIPGTDNGVLTIKAATTGATVPVGVATCYEVAFDQQYRHLIDGGAQILTVPTNNATFGLSTMSEQQLAMSRLRSIEFDRASVVAATSGISAMVTPDGKVVTSSVIFRSAALEATLPLRTTRTLAAQIGWQLELAMVCGGVLAVLSAGALARRVR